MLALKDNAVTVGEALRRAETVLRTAGLDTPRLDAEILLAHVLGASRADLLARLADTLPAAAGKSFDDLITRRIRHEPVAYLTHHKEFYELDFYVDECVLIPRPETELLVNRAIEIVNCELTVVNYRLIIADVGTGSGCIAVALAVNLLRAEIYATEASEEALEVAQVNVVRHRAGDRVHLIRSDLLRDLTPDIRFDVIVANLPYIATSELAELPPSVRNFEPVERALEAGPDGLDLYRRLLDQAPQRLRPGGTVLFEIGWQQGAAAVALARDAFPDADVRVWPDLAGRDRAIEIQTRGEQ